MTVNQLIDALTRFVVHGQLKGDSEVRFSTPLKNYCINAVYTSEENKKAYLSCVYTPNYENRES